MSQQLRQVTPGPDAGPDARRVARRTPLRHLTREERRARGLEAAASVPVESLARLSGANLRSDPIELLERQAATRVPELVPIRYGRMIASPLAFYRGGARIMASDLAQTPNSGLRVQLCGDAHLRNFGVFASPERQLVFDVNDFDETLPGPFEWDVKRLVASLEIAGRENGFKRKQRRIVVLAAARSYRQAMASFAVQSNLTVWYAHLNVDRELEKILNQLEPARARKVRQEFAKARTRGSLQAFTKLATEVDGVPRIISDPPLVVPITELLPEHDAVELFTQLRGLLRSYRRSLSSDRQHLLEQFHLVDMARKVVGVGSVGTRAWILLLQGVDGRDPLFLQAKEAQGSVLEDYAGASTFTNHGARVVGGQRLMQASSDIFLGWQRTKGTDNVDRDFYIRQLKDWKGAVEPESMIPSGMTVYGGLCAWTLARAHARSGDRVAIAAYLGDDDRFDRAMTDFAAAYADLNEADFRSLEKAAASGRVDARKGL